MKRIPSKLNFLNFYKNNGSDIKTIIDVGILRETRELKTVFSNQKQVLIEPVPIFRNQIVQNYKALPDVDYVWKAASNINGVCYVHSYSNNGGTMPTHSYINDNPNKEPKDLKVDEVEKIRVDDYVISKNYQGPFLIKVDVDGHDLEVLQGCQKIFKDTDVIIVEATMMKLTERAKYLEENGFILFDIVDQCYFRGRCWQVDLIFVSKKVYENVEKYPEINPLKKGFPIAPNFYQIH